MRNVRMRYEFIPAAADSAISHVGTYQRRLPVSLERMYENALDWAHLPHVHRSSFSDIQLISSGGWGWRAHLFSPGGKESVIELCLDRSRRRWITRNIEGPNAGAEIWTHVFVVAKQEMDLVIDFFVPGVQAQSRDQVGMAYARQYERLYDEDVEMMTERQAQLDLRIDSVGKTDELSLNVPEQSVLPHLVELSGRQFWLDYFKGRWVVYPAVCPHQLGPIGGQINAAGEVTCAWHAYRFDVLSGECTHGGQCRFPELPIVEANGAALKVFWAKQQA